MCVIRIQILMFNQEYKMENRYLKFSTLIILICFGLITILPAPALAGPGPHHRPGPGGKSGPVFMRVPPGGKIVRHKGGDYFFYRGRCYRRGPKGYFWVRPPIGIIAYGLPAAAVTVLIGGLTYYVYDNVYYKRVHAGYQVVQVPTRRPTIVQPPPAAPVKPVVSGARVVVKAKVLNVRSGPGINHAVLTRIYRGNILIIQGSKPDWYHVRLPDNTYGWVMKAFVSVPGNGPQG